MSRLSKLYDAIETLRKEGVSTDDLEEKVSQAEEDIFKKEILPILTQNIEPALQQVKRELVLVVDYQPGQPISVHLSRKRNFTAEIADAKEIVQDPIVEHGERKSKQEKIERSSPTDMAVFFPDGTMIAEEHAKDTLQNRRGKSAPSGGSTRVGDVQGARHLQPSRYQVWPGSKRPRQWLAPHDPLQQQDEEGFP